MDSFDIKIGTLSEQTPNEYERESSDVFTQFCELCECLHECIIGVMHVVYISQNIVSRKKVWSILRLVCLVRDTTVSLDKKLTASDVWWRTSDIQ